MTNAAENYLKAIPVIRRISMEIIRANPVYGEPVNVPCRECDIQIYIHRASYDNAPVLFEFHGGGFAVGDAAGNDNFRERVRRETDITVIGVNYRKAPEHPYPCALNDSFDVISYVHGHPEEFGIDPERMAVTGFSAGANIATVMAMKAKATGAFDLKCQILHYPYVDGASSPASKKRHQADIPLEVMEAFDSAYAEGVDRKRADISPLYATVDDLKGTAPAALFMAGEDALMDEGFAYAARLKQAGVEILAAEAVEEMHHGYMEDHFNRPVYEMQMENKTVSHSPRMGEQAEKVLKRTEEILENILKR